MEKETKKRERDNGYDCFFCHADMLMEREHLFHYIMGLAMYKRATSEQIGKLIECYAQIYNRPAEAAFLRLVNEIEQTTTCDEKS